MNDALNNPIIIGQTYGYSAIDTVCVGIAMHLTNKKVALKAISRRNFRYGDEEDNTSYRALAYVYIQSWHLFPVTESKQ